VSLDESLSWVRDGTQRMLADLGSLSDDDLSAPSRLPGWTRRHLLAHVAGNTDALRNLVHWARTGEERRMYASPEQRATDIEKGSVLPAAELRDWTARSAAELDADLAALPERAWDAKVITAQGLTRSASEIPWMRAREVYVHDDVDVDVDAGTGFADLPTAFLVALLDDVTARRSSVVGGPSLALTASDTGATWQVTGRDGQREITAPLAVLAGWLAGRPVVGLRDAAGAPAPDLPAWL
jgi:maleylpyruvate isomerase